MDDEGFFRFMKRHFGTIFLIWVSVIAILACGVIGIVVYVFVKATNK